MLKVFLEYFDNTAGGRLLAQTPATHCDSFWFTGVDQCDMALKICIEFLPQYVSLSSEFVAMNDFFTYSPISFTGTQVCPNAQLDGWT